MARVRNDLNRDTYLALGGVSVLVMSFFITKGVSLAVAGNIMGLLTLIILALMIWLIVVDNVQLAKFIANNQMASLIAISVVAVTALGSMLRWEFFRQLTTDLTTPAQ